MDRDILPKAMLAAMVSDFLAAENIDAKVFFFVNDIHPDESTPLSAFVEPVGTWYVPQTIVYGEPFEEDDGSIAVQAISQQMNYSGSSPSETIRGWFVKNITPSKLLHSRRLDADVTMGNDLDSVIVNPSFRLKPITA